MTVSTGADTHDYACLDALSEKGSVFLVRDSSDGRLLVSRHITAEQKPLYLRLVGKTLPGLPQIYHIEPDGEGYLVYEQYIQGATLQSVLEERGPLDAPAAVDCAAKLCDALTALHRLNIVHRDVKPGNILLEADGGVCLVDLGIARTPKPGVHQDTALLGTQGYAAPEQFGFGQSDRRADIYAMGVLLNVMLTGKLPSGQQVGGALGGIIKKCTAIDPAGRYSSAGELKYALSALPSRPLKIARVNADAARARRAPKRDVPIPEKRRRKLCLLTPREIFRHIPGFRTGKVWKALVAVCGYFYLGLIFSVILSSMGASAQMVLFSLLTILWIAGGFLFVCNCFSLRSRFSFAERHRQTPTLYLLLCLLILAAWTALVFAVLFAGVLLLSIFFPAPPAV